MGTIEEEEGNSISASRYAKKLTRTNIFCLAREKFGPRGCEKSGEKVCTRPVRKSDVWTATAPSVRPTRTNIREVDPYKHPLSSVPKIISEMFARVNDLGQKKGRCLYGSLAPIEG